MSEVPLPALTPDEWAQIGDHPTLTVPQGYHLQFHGAARGQLALGVVCIDPVTEPARALAAIHARLPDDSPRKITRADVREVRVAANQARAKSREYINAPELWQVHEQTADALDRLAAKLAALLPSEE